MRYKTDRRQFLKTAAAATLAVPAAAQSLRSLAGLPNGYGENGSVASDVLKEVFSEFPRRALIESPYENSLDARYVSKPVLDSAMVDDMETDRPWTVFGIGKRSYTGERAKDGKRSLRFQTSLRDECWLCPWSL